MKLYIKNIDTEMNIKDFLKIKNTFYYENDDYIYLGKGALVEFDALDSFNRLLNINVENNPKGLPFVGGFFGIFNYDLIKTYENIPQENKALFETKNILGLSVNTYYVVNKISGNKMICALDYSTKAGKMNAFKNIEILANELRKPQQFNQVNNRTEKYSIKSNTSKNEFIKKVKKAKAYIKNGDIFQVVLSQRFEVELNDHPSNLLEKIEHEKSTYKYYFNLKTIQVFGLSPEILVKKEGKKVKTNPIAGTRKRGKSKEEETYLEKDLLSDVKERAEHTMLVDLARNDMGKIAEIGSVEVKNFMSIKRYKNVIHLTSEVLGSSSKNNTEILKTFLPAGTLTGAPKIRAMEIIESLESDKREIYGGGIGYISFNKNVETAITIRTMVVKEQKAYIQAGAGIVYDSVPAREYEETVEKASQLIDLIKEANNDFVNR